MKHLLYLFIICCGFTSTLAGQEKSYEKIKAMHVAFITQKLELTPEESSEFWPVYNEYNKNLRSLRKSYNLKNYEENLSSAEAEQMISKINEYRASEVKIQAELNEKLKNIIPPEKIVRLYFAENEFKQEILNDLKKRYKDSHDKKSNDHDQP